MFVKKRSAILFMITGVFALLLLWMCVSQSKLMIQNVEFHYDIVNSRLIISDNRNSEAYFVRLDDRIIIQSQSTLGDILTLKGTISVDAAKKKFNPVQITVKPQRSAVRLTLEMTELYKTFEPVFLEVETPDDENQYFVIPYAEGMLIPAQEPYPFNEFYMWGYKATMPFTGITDLQRGLMVLSENPWDTSVRFPQSNDSSLHNMRIRLWPDKGSFSDARTLIFSPVAQDGYVAMAKVYYKYRKTRENVMTLQAKNKLNPNTDKMVGACDFWLLEDLGDKQFINRLQQDGIDKAIFSFYESWYVHDQEEDPGLIQYAVDNGFLAGRYDIDTDVWNKKDIPSHLVHIRTDAYPKDVVVTASNTYQKNWTRYLSGKPVDGYIVCSSSFWKYGNLRIGNNLIKNNYNTRFFDTILSLALLECYSTQHPLTRYDDMNNKKDYLQDVRDKYGLIMGSEDVRDYAVNTIDYTEGVLTIVASQNAAYSWLDPVTELGEEYAKYNMDATRRIPLFQLVYHNSVASTWYTGDSVSKVLGYWKKKDLYTVLYGCMPLIMPQNVAHWNENESDFLSSAHLAGAFYECVGYERLVSHQFISKDMLVQRTVFSNGWEVIGNFSDENIYLMDYTIPPNGFYATNGEYEIYRVLNGDTLLDVVNLDDRLFINPYGMEVTINHRTTDKILYSREN